MKIQAVSSFNINKIKYTNPNNNFDLSFGKKKEYTEDEKKFLIWRRNYSYWDHKYHQQYNKALWNYYLNASDENQTQLNSIPNMANLETMPESGNIKDPIIKNHVNYLNQKYIYDEKDLSQDIKSKFNNFDIQLNGKNTNASELKNLLKTETNPIQRKEIYEALISPGEAVADDMKKLIIERNKIAKREGYDNYFEYAMKEIYNLNAKDVMNMVYGLIIATKPIKDEMNAKRNEELAKAFNIPVEKLQPYHYGFQTNDDLVKIADSYIKTKEDNLEFSKQLYKGMGWDLDKLGINYDLYPRKGKDGHAYTFGIDQPFDVGVLGNLSANNWYSLETFNHENGHAVYYKGISNHLPYLDKDATSDMMSEAVAVLMERMVTKEPEFLLKNMNMPKDLVKKLNEKHKEDNLNYILERSRYLIFEYEMYKNPDRDLRKVWFSLLKTIEGKNPPDKLNNEWATTIYYNKYPAYLQNYIRAQLAASQIYKSFNEKYGCMQNNPKTAEFFNKKLFRLGKQISEDDAMIKLTGNSLGIEPFLNEVGVTL